MTTPKDPYFLYTEALYANEPAVVHLAGEAFRFQFFGPQQGVYVNGLTVYRLRDGLEHRFGPGHSSELVWRAYHHAQKDWDERPVPRYHEAPHFSTLEDQEVFP